MLILGIGGTTRVTSTGASALRYCLGVARDAGADTELLTARDLQLPLYDPALRKKDARAERLLELVASADAVILATPAYHAGISGLVKNALDHLEELRAEDPPYLEGRTVGCITTSLGSQGGALALVSLRSVIHALRGSPTSLGVVIDTVEPAFDEGGKPVRESVRTQLNILASQVLAAARQREGARVPMLVAAGPAAIHHDPVATSWDLPDQHRRRTNEPGETR